MSHAMEKRPAHGLRMVGVVPRSGYSEIRVLASYSEGEPKRIHIRLHRRPALATMSRPEFYLSLRREHVPELIELLQKALTLTAEPHSDDAQAAASITSPSSE